MQAQQRRRYLTNVGGQKAANVRHSRLWQLKSSILPLNFPKIGNFQPQVLYFGKEIFRQVHSGVAGPLAAQGGGQICRPFVLGF